MRTLIIIVALLVPLVGTAGWSDWNAAQKSAVTNFVVTNAESAPSYRAMLELMEYKPILSTVTNVVQVPRPSLQVRWENQIKSIARTYGLTKQMSLSEIDDTFQAAYQASGTVTAKDIVVSDRLLFWVGYTFIPSLDGTGEATRDVEEYEHTYGQSFAEENALGVITPDDLREAWRIMQ